MVCAVENCSAQATRRGWCQPHYRRWQRHGDPEGGRLHAKHDMSLEERLLLRRQITASGCWEYTGSKDSGGYGALKISGQNKKAHRIAYKVWVSDVPDDVDVLHHCDNPPCFNPEHLFLGNDEINVWDKMLKGRAAQKLTADEVVDIRWLLSQGAVAAEVARAYGVHPATICEIRTGKLWRHIP